jgi:acyl-CoA synthetase (NDP forming)
VNPKYKEIMGIKTFPSVKEIPEHIDLSLIIRPAQEVPGILKEHEGIARCAVIISSGFAETGQAGLQEEIYKIGKETGIRILGPNCMGVYNPYHKLDTFFLPPEKIKRPKKGNVSVVSQSGAILHCLFGIMRDSNIGISKAVTYGNAIDIDETDLYEYFAGDRSTKVVVSYIESVKDGRLFIEKGKKLSEKKFLIILKAGKGRSGQSAAYSHTGRLAGRYEVFHSILKQSGINEVKDFDELLDSVKALSFQGEIRRPAPASLDKEAVKRILIITNGGGSGVLASDECLRQGLDVPVLEGQKRERLKQMFPSFYVINNPIDLTAQVKNEDYIAVLKELKDDFDGFLIIALSGVEGISSDLADMLKDFKRVSNKPIVFHTSCSTESGKMISILEKARVPSYPSPERAVRGLKALLEYPE